MTEPTPTPSSPSRSRRRLLTGLLVALVPVVPIVLALLITGSSAHPPAVTRTQTSAYQPLTTASTPTTPPSPRHRGTVVPTGHGALVTYISHPRSLRASPGGRQIGEVEPKTNFGSPTFVLVMKVKRRWLGIINTAVGNNRVGWIRSRGLTLSRDVWRLHAVLSRHELYVFHNGHQVRHFLIAVGKPTAPTPTGHFAVTDRLTTGDPEGPYGCCILALSAKAPHHISDWDGGNRIAIHSTPETYSIGYSVSHGCMRLSLANGQWLIDHIPLGTPAVISSA